MPAALRDWTVGERRLIQILEQELNVRWGQCYASAQAATLLAERIGIHPHRLAYCEGVASLQGASVPFRHAWCLLNGQVWDPTPQMAARRATYVGREIPLETVKQAAQFARAWGPAALELQFHRHVD